MMLKLITSLVVIPVFVLFISTIIVKIFNKTLLKKDYKLSIKFSYLISGFLILVLSVVLGKSILYYLL